MGVEGSSSLFFFLPSDGRHDIWPRIIANPLPLLAPFPLLPVSIRLPSPRSFLYGRDRGGERGRGERGRQSRNRRHILCGAAPPSPSSLFLPSNMSSCLFSPLSFAQQTCPPAREGGRRDGRYDTLLPLRGTLPVPLSPPSAILRTEKEILPLSFTSNPPLLPRQIPPHHKRTLAGIEQPKTRRGNLFLTFCFHFPRGRKTLTLLVFPDSVCLFSVFL